MSGWYFINPRYPFTYSEPPESITLERTNHSASVRYVPDRGECRNKDRDYIGFWCSECDAHVSDGYLVGTDVEEFKYCPNCGRKVIEV